MEISMHTYFQGQLHSNSDYGVCHLGRRTSQHFLWLCDWIKAYWPWCGEILQAVSGSSQGLEWGSSRQKSQMTTSKQICTLSRTCVVLYINLLCVATSAACVCTGLALSSSAAMRSFKWSCSLSLDSVSRRSTVSDKRLLCSSFIFSLWRAWWAEKQTGRNDIIKFSLWNRHRLCVFMYAANQVSLHGLKHEVYLDQDHQLPDI